jgi:hypothetical protein
MVKTLALSTVALLAAAVAGLLGLALSKPDTYQVQREIVVAAAPATIFENLDDFRRWAEWSPWERLEPGVNKTYAGPPSGVGASYAWEGKDIGSGKLIVTHSSPPQKLAIRLELLKPAAETNEMSFELTPLPAATRVRWSMSGPTRFAAKLLSVFASTDAFIGRDLDAGLARLKTLCESPKQR